MQQNFLGELTQFKQTSPGKSVEDVSTRERTLDIKHAQAGPWISSPGLRDSVPYSQPQALVLGSSRSSRKKLTGAIAGTWISNKKVEDEAARAGEETDRGELLGKLG